jgi:hypothetical protein
VEVIPQGFSLQPEGLQLILTRKKRFREDSKSSLPCHTFWMVAVDLHYDEYFRINEQSLAQNGRRKNTNAI